MAKKPEQPINIIIKKKITHGGHHGGAWKVAFADFMTAMFAMFLVLWLVNQSSDVKTAIAGYFQDPLGHADEYGSSIIPGEGAQSQSVRDINPRSKILEVRRDRLEMVKKKLEQSIRETPHLASLQSHVEIYFTDEGLRIELIEDEEGHFFEGGQAKPSPDGQRILELLGRELGALALPVRIEGHTDAHPFPSTRGYTNWELSADRANAARTIMVGGGLKPTQVDQVRAFADRAPKIADDPLSARNRRVTVMMLLETADLPPEN